MSTHIESTENSHLTFDDRTTADPSSASEVDAALRAIEDALQANPNAVHLHQKKSRLLSELGRHHEAVEAAEAAVQLAPDRPHLRVDLSKRLARIGDYESAERQIETALAPGSNVFEYHMLHSGYLKRLQRLGDALAAARRAFDFASDDLTLIGRATDAILATGGGAVGLAAIDEALTRNPGIAGLHHQRSRVLARMGKSAEAMQAATSAIELAPNDPLLRADFAGLAIKGRDFKLALAEINKAIETNHGVADFHLKKSLAFDGLGNLVEAIATAREATRLAPTNAALKQHLAKLLVKSGAPDEEIIDVLSEAIANNNKLPELYHQKSMLLDRAGKLAEAMKAASSACELAPLNAQYLFAFANLTLREGDRRQALTLIDKAIGIDEKVAKYHQKKGMLLSHIGRHDEALEALKRAATLDPQNASTKAILSRFSAQAGDHRTALSLILQAIGIDDKDASFHLQKSMLLEKLGNGNEALAAAREALALDPKNARLEQRVSALGGGKALGRMYKSLKSRLKKITG